MKIVKTEIMSQDAAPAMANVKDLNAAALIEAWRGDSTAGTTVSEFFETLEAAASLGGWTDKDCVGILRLKLKGSALLFLKGKPELNAPGVKFEDIKKALLIRFAEKHPDQFFYTRLQSAEQEKGETPELFADRCRQLCRATVRRSEIPAEQRIIQEEADRRLLAAYVSGLRGVVGQQLRYALPKTMDSAVQLATQVYHAEFARNRVESAQPPRDSKRVFFTSTRRDVICFKCQRPGHTSPQCRQGTFNKNSFQGPGSNRGPRQGTNANSQVQSKQIIRCYRCQKLGHVRRDCRIPENKLPQSSGGRNPNGMGTPSSSSTAVTHRNQRN